MAKLPIHFLETTHAVDKSDIFSHFNKKKIIDNLCNK